MEYWLGVLTPFIIILAVGVSVGVDVLHEVFGFVINHLLACGCQKGGVVD